MVTGDVRIRTDEPKRLVRALVVPALIALISSPGAPILGQAQERASVTGWVVAAETGQAVSEIVVRLQPPARRSMTDGDGRFHFSDVRPGTYVLSVDDARFGAHTDMLEVPEAGVVQLSVRLGQTVFELAPIEVEVLGRAAIAQRAMGSPLYRIDRDQIEASRGGGMSPAEILRRRIPGITLDPGSALAPGCVEFRRPTSFLPGCQPPLVIVDGVRIGAGSHFLETTSLESIESLTVLSSSQAAILYGLGSLNGAIQVEMRRPGVDPPPGVGPAGEGLPAGALPPGVAPQPLTWKSSYNWDQEPGAHPWWRSWGGATVGMIGGLAVALAASGDCSPLNDQRHLECAGNRNLAGAATFSLPVLGGALGANLGGRTEGSRGRMIVTTLAAAMPMFAGFFFAVPRTDDVEFRGQEVFGRALVIAGVPIVAAAADRIFRTRR